MKRVKGLSAEGVTVAALVVMLALMGYVMRFSSQITGMSTREQLHQAVCVAADWD